MAEYNERQLYQQVCKGCGCEILTKANRPCFCPDCKRAARRESYAKYRQSEKGRAARKARTERYKADGRLAEWYHRYAMSEKNRVVQQRYNDAHREERTEYMKKWRAAHRAQVNARARKYYAAHIDEKREASRRYYLAHREERIQRHRLYYAAKRNKPGARLLYARAIGKAPPYCERMRVSSFNLPCGKREECRGCVHCPKGADCVAAARLREYAYTGGWY